MNFFKDTLQWGLERLYKEKRIYLHGAGGVGKTSFIQSLVNTSMMPEEIHKFIPTAGAEKEPYALLPELPSEFSDYRIKILSYGGQEYLRVPRIEHLRRARPHAVIFVLSPFILTEDSPKPPKTPEFLKDDEMWEENARSIREFVEFYTQTEAGKRNSRTLNYILPAISYWDEWRNSETDFVAEFQRKFAREFVDFGQHDVRIAPIWQHYSSLIRPTVLRVFQNAVTNSGHELQFMSPLRSENDK